MNTASGDRRVRAAVELAERLTPDDASAEEGDIFDQARVEIQRSRELLEELDRVQQRDDTRQDDDPADPVLYGGVDPNPDPDRLADDANRHAMDAYAEWRSYAKARALGEWR